MAKSLRNLTAEAYIKYLQNGEDDYYCIMQKEIDESFEAFKEGLKERAKDKTKL